MHVKGMSKQHFPKYLQLVTGVTSQLLQTSFNYHTLLKYFKGEVNLLAISGATCKGKGSLFLFASYLPAQEGRETVTR